ncbi:hypothetical protein ACIG87_15050 [Micromonospora sp. NPDC051925]|uniref:hypothetical protein n=1 Tax=Micromonospora sp. NPDC051925 TaxID=3364288 RepID=UPI0037C5CA75
MKGFTWTTFKENVAIALKVAELLGVPRKAALTGMWTAPPDPGVLSVEEYRRGEKSLRFANIFAANDPESTFMNIQQLEEQGSIPRPLHVLINCRPDRVERNGQMGSLISRIDPDKIILIGEPTRSARVKIDDGWQDRVVDLGGRIGAQELLDGVLASIDGFASVLAIGNIHGQGEILLAQLGGLDRPVAQDRPATPVLQDRRPAMPAVQDRPATPARPAAQDRPAMPARHASPEPVRAGQPVGPPPVGPYGDPATRPYDVSDRYSALSPEQLDRDSAGSAGLQDLYDAVDPHGTPGRPVEYPGPAPRRPQQAPPPGPVPQSARPPRQVPPSYGPPPEQMPPPGYDPDRTLPAQAVVRGWGPTRPPVPGAERPDPDADPPPPPSPPPQRPSVYRSAP